MSDLLDESRNRPVVFQTSAEPSHPRRLRRPAGVLAGATLVVVSLAGAAGLAFGGSAVWSVVGPKGGDAPAPLWLPPPPSISQAPPSPRHDAPADIATLHPNTATAGHLEPGDLDHNAARSGRGRGGSGADRGGNSGSGRSGSGGSGSGRSPGGSGSTANQTHEETATQGAPATETEPEPGHDENRRGAGGSGGSGGSSGGSDDSGGGGGGSSGGSGSSSSGGSGGSGSSGGGGRH